MGKIIKSVTLYLMCTLQVGPTVFAADELVDYSGPESEKDAIILENIEVIGVTPISGTGLPPEKIPANVQTVTSDDLLRGQNLNLFADQCRLRV